MQQYKFYGWETADVKDRHGLTPRDYYDRLSDIWCRETCAPRLRAKWSPENKTLGQCSITAFLLQDLYGGKVYGVPLSDGNFHCFNDVDGYVFDLTSEQFGDTVLNYKDCPEQFREVHFAKEEKRRRYELLRSLLFSRVTKSGIALSTERLRLRPASQEEMRAIIDAEPDEILKTAYREMLRGALEHPDRWEWYAIWLIERQDGARVGDLCFKGLNGDGSVEIGYGILEEYRGRGYATEAVGAAVDWALHRPGVRRVEAETEPDNKESQRVLEKCGFLPTGMTGEEGPRFAKTL